MGARRSSGSESTTSLKNILVAIHHNQTAVAPFTHALRLAYAAKGDLEIVDVRIPEERINTIGVRDYLEKWRILPADSKRSDVVSAGIRVTKVIRTGNQRMLVKQRLQQRFHDLLIVGTEDSCSTTGIFSSSLATYLADYFRHSTLFMPSKARPFIDAETGSFDLQRVLMPIEHPRYLSPAFTRLSSVMALFPSCSVEVTVMHAGSEFPEIERPEHKQVEWNELLCAEPVVEAIGAAAEKTAADLIVMATNGRNTLSRKIVGSITERVLGVVTCPVLSVAVTRK